MSDKTSQPPVPEGLDELRTRISSRIAKYADHVAKHGTGYFEHREADLAVLDDIMQLVQSHQPKPQPVSGDMEGLRKSVGLYVAALASSGDNFRVSSEAPAISQELQDEYVERFVQVFQSHLTQFKERAVADINKLQTYRLAEGHPDILIQRKDAAQAIRGIEL